MKNIIWQKLLGFVVISELAGIVGSIFTRKSITEWYNLINKPNFRPPNWLFGPVWTILYFLQGLAAYLVWASTAPVEIKRSALNWFWIQLALNFVWTPLFFGLRNPKLAFFEIIFLWLAIIVTMVKFSRVSNAAVWLMSPYLLWVSFASYLNFSIWQLNK